MRQRRRPSWLRFRRRDCRHRSWRPSPCDKSQVQAEHRCPLPGEQPRGCVRRCHDQRKLGQVSSALLVRNRQCAGRHGSPGRGRGERDGAQAPFQGRASRHAPRLQHAVNHQEALCAASCLPKGSDTGTPRRRYPPRKHLKSEFRGRMQRLPFIGLSGPRWRHGPVPHRRRLSVETSGTGQSMPAISRMLAAIPPRRRPSGPNRWGRDGQLTRARGDPIARSGAAAGRTGPSP